MAPSLILNRKPQVRAEESAAFGPIAERFRRAGDLERAASLCREGLERFPHHISARVTLGWALLDLGKYEEARVELEQVLRRAPDNLAAIRGLAELHDRAEHTLHLPMDGPGQWPPDEAAVNQAASLPAPDDQSGDMPVTLISAGEPQDVAEFETVADAERSAVFTPDVFISADPELPAAGVAAVDPSPAPEPDRPIVLPETAAPQSPGLDVDADQLRLEASPQPEQQPMTEAAQAPVVSEADIAALIAEAEKLEAEAEAEAVAGAVAEVIELAPDAAAELDALEEAAALLAPASEVIAPDEAAGELSAPADAPADQPAPVAAMEEPVAPVAASAAEDQPAPVAAMEEPVAPVAASAAEDQPAPVAAMEEPVAPVAATAMEERPLPAAAEVAEEAPVPAEETAEAPVAAAGMIGCDAGIPAAALVTGVAAVAETEAARDASSAFAELAAPAFAAFADEAAHETTPVAGAAEAIVVPAATTPGAEVVLFSPAAGVEPGSDAIVGLERFLSKVQARRRQTMTESVA